MPHHVVVDGSNLATEGRTAPSLKQLNEAVLAYMAEDPTALITVVVDATFGHRIDPKEVAEFDEAVSNNELVAPPAGAIGRGDAFVLSIANKVNANILTNDSYQEFHAQYDWLFDEGRLIGGKPVPHIGWVFVNRLPVRGPLSRKVVAEAKRKGPGAAAGGRRGRGGATAEGTVRVGSPEASLPMPVPKSPPPRAAAKAADAPVEAKSGGRGRGRGGERTAKAAAPVAAAAATVEAVPAAKHTVNDLLSFLTFVERHPAGTSVTAVVDHYSSHGAYVRIENVMGYVPLRLMADPAPRSAREFMKVGETVTLVVESFVPAKRSIDLAIPGMGTAVPLGEAAPPKPAKAAKATKAAQPAKPSKSTKAGAPAEPTADAPVAAKPARRGAKAAAVVAEPVATPAVEVVAAVAAGPAKGRGRKGAAKPVAVPVDAVSAPVAAVAKRQSRPAKSPASTPAPETVAPAAGRSRAKKAAAPAQPAPAARGGRAKPAAAQQPAAAPATVTKKTAKAAAPTAPVKKAAGRGSRTKG